MTQSGSPKGRHTILDFGFSILDCGLKQHPERQKVKGKRQKMPTSMKPKGVEHPLPTFAFCLPPPCVKPKGVEHPERQKGEDGATHSLVPGKRGWPQCHANQVVPATGLVDDAMPPARTKDIVGQAGKPDLLPCRGDGFPAIRRRLTHGRVRLVAGNLRASTGRRSGFALRLY